MRHGWRPGKPDGRAVKPARQADVSARLRERVFPIDQDRGRAVEKVRRAWLADAFLTRTSPPKNAEAFLALAVIHGEHTQEHNTLYTKLSHGESGYQATAQLVSRAQAATPKQTLMLALALLVCEWESATSRSTWRNPRERDDRYLMRAHRVGLQALRRRATTPGPTGRRGGLRHRGCRHGRHGHHVE